MRVCVDLISFWICVKTFPTLARVFTHLYRHLVCVIKVSCTCARCVCLRCRWCLSCQDVSPCKLIDFRFKHTHSAETMLNHLRARSRSLFPSYKPGSRTQAVKEPVDCLDFTNTCVKPWSSMQVRRFSFSCFMCLFFSSLCSSLLRRWWSKNHTSLFVELNEVKFSEQNVQNTRLCYYWWVSCLDICRAATYDYFHYWSMFQSPSWQHQMSCFAWPTDTELMILLFIVYLRIPIRSTWVCLDSPWGPGRRKYKHIKI